MREETWIFSHHVLPDHTSTTSELKELGIRWGGKRAVGGGGGVGGWGP